MTRQKSGRYCKCYRVESYRANRLGDLVCGSCDKKLGKQQWKTVVIKHKKLLKAHKEVSL